LPSSCVSTCRRYCDSSKVGAPSDFALSLEINPGASVDQIRPNTFQEREREGEKERNKRKKLGKYYFIEHNIIN
jgi:hypothetical protein